MFRILTIALCISLTPGVALAWNQTKTCIDLSELDPLAPTSSPICEGNETGNGFHWSSPKVPYSVNRDGSPDDFPHDQGMDPELLVALREAFEVWNAPECSRFEFVGGELTDVSGFDPRDGVNVVVFQSDWPYASQSIALSSVTVRPDGEIVDADMELNDEAYEFTNTDPPERVAIDVRNTVTHEAGHVLGLDHSPVADATMQFSADQGDVNKRDLDDDDIAGLCAIYPLNPPEEKEEEDDGCCTQVSSQSTTPWWVPLVLGVSGWILFLRRP